MSLQKKPFPYELFNKLSKNELQVVLELLHYSAEASTDEDVKKILVCAQKFFPCEYGLAGVVRINAQGTIEEWCHLLNINYPSDWVYEYSKNGYTEVDPVLTAYAKSYETQVWKGSSRKLASKRQNEFIEHAKSFGLASGITSGSLDRARGLCSFVSLASSSSNNQFNKHYAGVFEYLVQRLHTALVKNTPTTTDDESTNILSVREMSVLKWMTQGKTNWEISRILGVSERTIRFHVESIFSKLDVTSRSHAVAMALQNRMLTYA